MKIHVNQSVNKKLGVKYWEQLERNITSGPKTNANKTETFSLFGKIVKKLIITGISIVSCIITQWETILW